MKINLKTAVSRLFPSHSLDMVYIEAIANALDADATNIEMSFKYKDSRFSEFKIEDNGVGINEKRYFKFSNLMETDDATHKGQGRLVYLHYFNNVIFESLYKENNVIKKIKFSFNENFDESNRDVQVSSIDKTGTKLIFQEFIKQRISSKRELSAIKVKENLLTHFLPCFQKMKENNQKFRINISSNVDDEISHEEISEKDIPEFEKVEIDLKKLSEVSTNLSKKIATDIFREPLTLYFYINNLSKNKSIVTSFAIDNRAVDVPIIDDTNYLEGVEAIFFLSSKSLDGLVDGSRKDLIISNSDLKVIKKIFKEELTKILDERVPQFQTEKNEQELFFANIYPHLQGYIPIEEIGFNSRKDILNKARDRFFDDQREILEKENLDENDYKKAIELSSRNLAEYIIFRQKQIDKLKAVSGVDKEKVIHDLISPRKDADTQENLDIFRNNAWILDDRFMTFSHSFSDLEMSKISELEVFGKTSGSKKRPDFLILFSKPLDNKPQEVDIVIFEFKRLSITTHRNFDATTELLQHAREVQNIYNEVTNVGRIWLYALVDIDDEFKQTLEDTDFKHRFTTAGETWYRYYENRNVEISYLDFKALVADAETRNRTFMDILRDRFMKKID